MPLIIVRVPDLKKGMYVQDLRMSWIAHDFLLPRFLIDNDKLLNKLKNLEEDHCVVVDTEKCILNETDALVVKVPEVEIESFKSEVTPVGTPQKSEPFIEVSFEEELNIAKKIAKEAKQAVQNAMTQARSGKIKEITAVQEISQKMVESISRNQGPLLTLATLKNKDDYTFFHSVSVSIFMIALGKKLNFTQEELTHAGTAGLLHDVGKGCIPDAILNKPDGLTSTEYAIMKKHPELGYKILLQSGYSDSEALQVVLHHHERLDGKGYPGLFKGDEINKLTRMGAIADVYDAVTSDRSYHKAIPPSAALGILVESGGTHFDANIVRAFISTLGLYPNGSLVRLRSNKLGIVLAQNPKELKKPMVYVMYSVSSNTYIEGYKVEDPSGKNEIISYEDPLKWGINVSDYFQKRIL